jgi:hypothetical protein
MIYRKINASANNLVRQSSWIEIVLDTNRTKSDEL